jgi:hypothetical protein
MKRIPFVFLLSSFFVLYAFSQDSNYILPLLTQNKVWTIAETSIGSHTPISTQSLKVWKDTLINGENYSIIVSNRGTDEWDTIHYYNLFREEMGKIYRDTLFYDFTMEVGDTLKYSPENMVILDSIINKKMFNGEFRKHYYIDYYYYGKYNNTFLWIEGIGSVLGLERPIAVADEGGGGSYLLCVHENGEQIYQSPYYDGCYVKQEEDSILPLLSKDKIWSTGNFGYYPNPPTLIPSGSSYYKIWKDLQTDGKTYSLIISSTDEYHEKWDTILTNGLREEGHKVYWGNTLLYDFGMKAGDTINYGGNLWFVLDSIKPMQISNGDLRKHFYLSHTHHQVVWIEGIGSTGGLFDPTNGFEAGGGLTIMLCVEENGEKIYQSPLWRDCYINNYNIENLLNENKKWNIGYLNSFGGSKYSEAVKSLGDTTITSEIVENDVVIGERNIQYKKIYKSTDENEIKWEYSAAMREIFGLVFIVPKGETEQKLLYNFNILPKDTFVTSYGMPDSLIVDSLLYRSFAGKERLHWYMHSLANPGSPQTIWVEGIGRLGDILHSTSSSETDSIYSFLLCFEENGKQVYQNPLYNRCDFNYTSVSSLENHQRLIDLFSTGNGLLQLQSKNNTSGEIMLYTTDGKQVLKEQVYGIESTICTPLSGLLLYRFVTEKGEVQTGKVVVR